MSKRDLVTGPPLIVEDLDLSGLGLYFANQIDTKDPDVFDSGYLSFGRTLYKKKSDEGKKWHVFNDSEIKLQSVLVKK